MSMPQQSQMRSRNTWTNAPTRSVDVVIFLNHLAAELDRWDHDKMVPSSNSKALEFLES